MEFDKIYNFVMNHARKNSIHPVIMFTGKREVKDPKTLNDIGVFLAERFPEAIFRAGNQEGADKEFIANIPSDRLQILPPYLGHKKSNIPDGSDVCALDEIKIPAAALSYFKQVEPGLHKAYTNGRGGLYEKSRYLLRNLAMIYGFKKGRTKYPQASLAIYFDDLSNPKSGGTGFTVNACKQKGVSPLNQKIWSKWI